MIDISELQEAFDQFYKRLMDLGGPENRIGFVFTVAQPFDDQDPSKQALSTWALATSGVQNALLLRHVTQRLAQIARDNQDLANAEAMEELLEIQKRVFGQMEIRNGEEKVH